MNKQELMNGVAEIKEELRNIVETAETEKRSLSDEEKTLFEEKQNRLNELKESLATVEAREQAQIEAEEANKRSLETKENKNKNNNMEKTYLKNLAQQISDVANNRSLEGYNNVTGNTINLRGDAYSATGDVDDVQGLQYTKVIEPLQDAVIFDKLGLSFINTGELIKLPSVTAVECSINGENTTLETQKVEFSNKAITPVRLGCAVGLSNTAVKKIDSNVDLVTYSLKAMREAEGRLINKMVLSPVAVTNATDGVTVKGPFVDVLAGDASVAGKATWANLIGLETEVKNKNAEITERAAFVMSPASADKLRSKPIAVKAPYGSEFILKDGKIDGIPVYETNAVNKYDASGNLEYSYIGFCSDWSTMIVQEVGAPDLVIDPYTKAKANETELVLNDNLGFSWERDAVFSVMKVDASSFIA